MWTQTVSLWLTAVAALGACLAAIASLLSARATRHASDGQLFTLLHEKYATDEMLWAVRTLREWESTQGPNRFAKWGDALLRGDERAKQIDRARRYVKFYFFLPLRLYDGGLVKKRFVREVCRVAGLYTLFDVVEPLDKALSPKYDCVRYEKLRNICGTVWVEHDLPIVPPGPAPSPKPTS
jgi:hypothetical protein